jgi:hypothetical protein
MRRVTASWRWQMVRLGTLVFEPLAEFQKLSMSDLPGAAL